MPTWLIHWSADPVALKLGPLSIHWYGLCWALGLVMGETLGRRLLKSIGREDVDAGTLLVCAFAGTLIGARLAHCLFYEPAVYLAHPLRILAFWEGGLASHGGAVGMILGLWLGVRRFGKGLPILTLLDVAAVPAALGSALIRLGNFMNSEIVGHPTDGTWGVVFERIDALPRHPVQLYEALVYVGVFAVLWKVAKRPQRIGTGLLLGAYMLAVFSARIVLEHWKLPQAAYEAGFAVSVGQWLSVPFVLLGVALIVRALQVLKQRRQQGQVAA